MRPDFLLLDGLEDLSRNTNSQFYDLEIFCSDGLVTWNRFCLAMFGEFWRDLLESSAESYLYIPDIRKDYLESILRKTLVSKVDSVAFDDMEQVSEIQNIEEMVDDHDHLSQKDNLF